MNEEQIAYVRAALAEGRTREEITAKLKERGYNDEQIAAFFSVAVSSTTATMQPPVAGTVGSLPTFGAFFHSVITVVQTRWDLVLVLGVVSFATTFLGDLMDSYEDNGRVVLGLLPFMLMAMVASVIVSFAAFRNVLEAGETLAVSIRWVVHNIFSVLWVAALSTLVLFAGLPLVVPAIALVGYLVFAQLVRIKEGVRGLNALVRSTVLVRGNWWGIAWRSIGLMVLGFMLVVMLTMVGNIVYFALTPLLGQIPNPDVFRVIGIFIKAVPTSVVMGAVTLASLAAAVALYEPLAAHQPTFNPEAHPRLRLLYKVLAIAGPVLFIGFMVSVMGIIVAAISANGQ